MKTRKRKAFAWCLTAAMVLGCLLPMADVSAARKTRTVSDKFDNASLVGAYDSEIWSEYADESSFRRSIHRYGR